MQIRRRRVAFAAAVTFTLVFSLSNAMAATSTVYPTGISPNDAAAVQAAVASGGTVLLKAVNAAGAPTAFNFGGNPGVQITTDVTILGETSNSGMTTIEGGVYALYVTQSSAASQIQIQGIHFDHQVTAIKISKTSGAMITRNWITSFSSAAISFVTSNPSTIFGTVTISNNTIDSANTYADGIFVFAAAATVEVTGNDIRNVGELGLIAVPGGPLSISGNYIAPGLGDDVNTFGDAIAVVPETASDDPLLIDSNVLKGLDLDSQSITVIEGRPTTIIHNQMSLQSPNGGGIVLFGNIAGAYVGQNRVDGMGVAIGILDDGSGAAVGNALVGNNLTGVQSSLADLLLDQNTQGTIVTGSGGATVIDLGTNNQITGAGSVGHANIGQGMRSALATKQLVTQALRKCQ